jgi:hypothetical protein
MSSIASVWLAFAVSFLILEAGSTQFVVHENSSGECPRIVRFYIDHEYPCESGRIVFEGLKPEYRSVAELARQPVTIRNLGNDAVYVDPIQVEIPVILRLNEDSQEWEEAEGLRCANAGAGTPRILIGRGTIEVQVPFEQSLVKTPEETTVVSMDGGERRAIGGTYRLALRYSIEPWPALKPPANSIFVAMSVPFLVGGNREPGQ